MSASDVSETDLKVEAVRRMATVLRPLRAGDALAAVSAAEQVDRWIASLSDPMIQSRLLYQLAEWLDDAGLRDEAQRRFERSLTLSRGHAGRPARLGTGLCLQRLGGIHRDAGRLLEALDHYRQAIERFSLIGDQIRAGSAWNNLGLAQHHGGDLEAAEDSYRRALALGEQTGNVLIHATSLGNLGKVALDRFHLSKAEQQLKSAIKLTRTLDDPGLLASQLGDLGNVLRARGQIAEAARCYREALHLSEAQGDARGQHLSLGNLGALYWERGELSQALLYLERSHAISQEHGSSADQRVSDLVYLALVQKELGEQGQAAAYLQTALALAEASASEHLAGVLNALGHLALEEGNLDRAEDFYRRCLAVEKQIGDTYNLGTSWHNLGYVAWQRDDIGQAIVCWQRALEHHQAASNRSGLAATHLNLGSALVEQGEFSTAEAHFKNVLDIAEAFPLPDDARLAWTNLAVLHWRQGNLTGAREAYHNAIAWAERSRAAVASQTHRIAFWPTLEEPYLGLIQLSLAMSDKRGAWETVQQARSRALAELLGGSRLPAPDHLPIEMFRREETLLACLRRIHTLTTNRPTPEEMAELLEVAAALDMLWTEMQPLAPEYVGQRRGEPATLKSVRACLQEVSL